PLEDIADAEFLGDQPYVDRLALVDVHGIARDDEQASLTGKVGDQVFELQDEVNAKILEALVGRLTIPTPRNRPKNFE
ncbi:hypothetical protein AB9F35_36725, partial [Rhizobium leguminosarum]|uniref:hypothetical protein n=1 Tax=Rhizobium leguminosarum TaxID=384 RepID=UPI003F9CA051